MATSSSLQGVQMLGSVGEILNVRNTLSVPAGGFHPGYTSNLAEETTAKLKW